MSIRRALVATDGSAQGEATVILAIDWASRSGAELVGLVVPDEPPGPAIDSVCQPGGSGRHHSAASLARAHRRVLEFQFQRRCEAAGLRCAVADDVVGAPPEQVLAQAPRCDVVILGQALRFPVEAPGRPDALLSRVLRDNPHPTVIVPSDPLAGTGVLVAYASGREVAQTLQTFILLGVARDEPVCLLAIDPGPARAEARLQPAGQFLAPHGARVSLQPVGSEEAPAAVILDEARRRRPRVIMMGAHGHHPVRDLFFTSVTRAVLREAPVPVFVGA